LACKEEEKRREEKRREEKRGEEGGGGFDVMRCCFLPELFSFDGVLVEFFSFSSPFRAYIPTHLLWDFGETTM
jgi:hypothetical protein